MNLISDDKMTALYEAIEKGYSRSQMARYAGVSERTAVSYLRIATDPSVGLEIPIPKNCGCGRPLRHLGRCNWRRNQKALRLGM